MRRPTTVPALLRAWTPARAASEAAPKSEWNPLTLALLTSAWIASAANWPLWRALLELPEVASFRGALFVSGFWVIVAALTSALLAVFAWHRTIRPAIAVFLASAALGAHFMGNYGVVIDATLMNSVLQTDPGEVRELLSIQLLFSIGLLAFLPALWLRRLPVRRDTALRQLGRNALGILGALTVLAILVLMLFADLSATLRNHKSIRYLVNPLNSFYALAVLPFDARSRAKGPPQPIGVDARLAARSAGSRPPLLALVVGETARSDHFSLNGYARPTNRQLSELDVVSFRDVSACGTNTAESLPCMFSHLGRKGFMARERDHENLLDLVQRAGLAVLWLDNQSGCKGVCDRVPNANARDPAPGGTVPPGALCPGGECFDEALLHELDARISALPAERRARGVLLVLHQMGSHGPAYFKRAPAERKLFRPECTTKALQQCERHAVINAYDNSIAYTDHVMARLIAWLQRQSPHYNAALLYVSDHGESLGENNLYLHGLPYAVAPREQTRVPMLAWIAPQSGIAPSSEMACLRLRRDAPLSHDHVFHTALGLLSIEAGEYRRELDAFADCRKD